MQAMADLQSAKNRLDYGRSGKQATKSFENAAEELSEAANRVALEAISQAAQQLAKSSGKEQGGSGGAGGASPQTGGPEDEYANLPDLAIGDGWGGPGQKLEGKAQKGRKSAYREYYRKANRKYLEWVAGESKKWQKTEE